MGEPHVISALRDKRAELSGTIRALESKIGQHRANLMHLDATLRLFAPEIDPGSITPKRPKARNEWFRHGECLRLIYDVLRDSAAPINTGEVVCRLMTIKGIESADRATARLFSKAVNSTLLRARDTIETVPVGKEMCWRIKAAA